ncbi:MAG: hypothetical protein QOE90_1234 [Thermoplasmata archaeon]|jgi:uncharacterized membrane protein|nr:hypothetical protein [Thermoplasmata archaeon]
MAARAWIERNALWLAVGALAVAAGLVAVGVAVAPRQVYDHFVWEDLYGPLVVDAHQCRTSADAGCTDLGPAGVPAKDGYTITAELTYGVVLATLLYGIYMGLFRRFRIRADGAFVAALLPWILLGPTGRVLEDADVFCHVGTQCDPSPFAFLFISPVIYVMIALYVLGAMLVGLLVERTSWSPAQKTLAVAVPVTVGLATFAYASFGVPGTFSALPPFWWIAVACVGAVALVAWRAREGAASMNLVVFALGLPFVAGTLWLIVRWLLGDVWAPQVWNRQLYFLAAVFVLLAAGTVALLVMALGRLLGNTPALARWAGIATRVPKKAEEAVGWAGGIALALAALMAGILPNLAPFFEGVPRQDVLIPLLAALGALLLLVFAALHVGREVDIRPRALLTFAAGLNASLVFAHMIDGFSTWVALRDPLGFGIPPYSEKHPFSDFLLRYLGGFLYPLAKLLMIVAVVWLLDRELPGASDDAKDDERNLVGLVKLAIFALGLGPGLRDLLRLAMGV